MRQEAYFCTVKELDELGKNNIPRQLISHTHLIYSSPATLAFNSPGAEGFGVKRAGLAVPDSVMLIVSPGCCGRNTSVLSSMRAYQDRFYYLLMDETDIAVSYTHLVIWQELENYIKNKERKLGYLHVMTPCVGTVNLYKTSGHWDHYKENMFPPMEMEGESFVLRPMNCPHHMMILSLIHI